MLRLVQNGGRWLFLRVDALFNFVLGHRLNPLYCLGAISYVMFWTLLMTGLYLMMFFKTNGSDALASVDALTHDPWGLGRLMRSAHRYASDGLVLTMSLHLVRHFAFDRYRAFHWVSWVGGAVLLWLVLASGAIGYMLPRDPMAQFVTIATLEWFDWLPVFNGALLRNFVFPDKIHDGLFAFLSFLHVGIPLCVLGLLWFHTQRVPKARTAPPWPLALTVGIVLVALSIMRPVASYGPAESNHAGSAIGLDWFFLALHALIDRWGPGPVWALFLATTLLFLFAPWLAPKRDRRVTGFHMLVRPDNRIVSIREGESILDAGLREGIAFPFECRNGGCGQCKCTLAYGRVDHGYYQPRVLSEEERAQGKALMCSAKALSDVEVVYTPISPLGGIRARTYTAVVSEMERLTPDVMRLVLRLTTHERIGFYPGQYINILLDSGEKRSFSFATAPHQNDRIELHIRHIPDGKFTTQVFTRMKESDVLRFEGPLGAFFLREDRTKPIIFVAGSTGFAPVKSMLEHAFYVGMRRQMILYWGVRELRDLYAADLLRNWAKAHPNFSFVPVLSEPAPEDEWTGRKGLVHQAILEDFPDLANHQVYACGSVSMVQAAHPAFMAQGLTQDDCFSDILKFVPQIGGQVPEFAKLGGSS